MKIIIVRHGEPDYEIDGLTEKGKREVEFLADKLCKENITKVYCSPLGRAKLTAEPTLKRLNIEAEYHDWLREFTYATVRVPYRERPTCAWDLLPEFVNSMPEIYSKDKWLTCEFIKNSTVPQEYEHICTEFDKILLKHGYRRDGYNYIAERPNHDVLVFVCHFGLTGILLSHIMNCSPYTIWQNFCSAPSATTTIYTEERMEGKVSLRAQTLGDLSHLYAKGEEPSFAARYKECFTDGINNYKNLT